MPCNVIGVFLFGRIRLKRLLCFFIIISTLSFVQANENGIASIYQSVEKGVVYIEQALYLDSSNSQNIDLYQKIENSCDFKIIDRYITITNGSGFFITSEGHLITNFHVVDISNLAKHKIGLLNKIKKDFINKIPRTILSEKEIKFLLHDYEKVIEKSFFEYRAVVKNENCYIASLVDFNSSLDVAVLKIDVSNSTPLILEDSENIKIGNSIMTIGYPMISASVEKCIEYYPTMTMGHISSIKPNTWGLQHTAPTNPGSSGGPLINMEGKVVGINVAIDIKGNNINFSIPSKHLIQWLSSTSLKDLLTKNKKDKTALNTRLETGKIVFVDLDPGYKIFVNGVESGESPMLVKYLKEGENILRISSGNTYSEHKLLVKKEITEIVILKLF